MVYLIGTASSAWVGELAGRLGRRRVLWVMIVIMLAGVALTLFDALPVIIAGIVAVTFGFFGGAFHRQQLGRQPGRDAKAQASALYLFCYYLGSSAIGTLGGVFWSHWGWPGVAGLVAVLLVAALALAFWLACSPVRAGQGSRP